MSRLKRLIQAIHRRSLWLLFVVGFGTFMLTRRSELFPTLPVAIVLAPIFILRLSRSLPARRAMVVTVLGFVLSMNVSLWGLFDLSDGMQALAFNFARGTGLALLYATPYLIDRIIFPRAGNGFGATLVFPVAITAVLFLASLEGPFDGTVAKTIYATGPLALLQLYSITGLWGFVFLWSWPAALVDRAWDLGFDRGTSARAALAFALVGGLALAYGGLRLRASPPTEDTVKVAAVVLLPEDGKPVSMEILHAQKRPSPYRETLSRIEARTSEAAAGGARIVAFQEYAMTVLARDVDRVRADYTRVAVENAVWLSITYAWYADQGKGANTHLLIDPEGQIRADYQKRFLFGYGEFGETAVFSKGEEVIPVVDSPYGRIALSICRDMSFPPYARQAGDRGADIMLTPSYDFPKSTGPSDYGRGIESGFAHVRPTYNGVSYVATARGRILGRMDSAEGGSGILYAEVPVRGKRTLYASLGDWFGWSNVASLLVFAALAITRR